MAGANRVRSLAVTPVPLVLLAWNTGSVWHGSQGLLPDRVYALNVLLFWLVSAQWIWLGFRARQRHPWGARALLVGAGLLGAWASCDLAVLVGAEQSLGPDVGLSLSHRHWRERNVRLNSLGYWDTEPGDAPIVAVGDSFTWGQGVHSGQRFTDILTHSMRVRVANFGIPGSSTSDQLRQAIPELPQVKPKIVLLCYLANDIGDPLGQEHSRDTQPSALTRTAIRLSPTWNWLYFRALWKLTRPEAGRDYRRALLARYQDPEAMGNHSREIQAMVSAVRRSGARPVAVILPFPELFEGVSPAIRERIYSAIRAAFQNASAPVIELEGLETAIPLPDFAVNAQDGHPSPRVHRAIAEGIQAWLRRDGWAGKNVFDLPRT